MTRLTFLERLRVKQTCLTGPYFEFGPYLSLGFLAVAFPPLQQVATGPRGDFIFGLTAGLSVLPVVLPKGKRVGWPGWMKAWGLGLFLSSFALQGSRGFLSGHWADKASGSALGFDPWHHFLLLLSLSLLLGAAFYRMAVHRGEAERQRELALQASQAALRAKLAPHFIFNTLNTLHAQIEADPPGAQATIERLAQLFRQVLVYMDRPAIPLRQELAFVEAYLGIEQARLGDRLSVRIDVPEDMETVPVPPMSLQVLVENAIKHGVAPLELGGEVRVGAVREDGAIHLWVEDPGMGLSPAKGTGTALETLRQRLERPEDLEMGMVGGRHRVSFRWRRP